MGSRELLNFIHPQPDTVDGEWAVREQQSHDRMRPGPLAGHERDYCFFLAHTLAHQFEPFLHGDHCALDNHGAPIDDNIALGSVGNTNSRNSNG